MVKSFNIPSHRIKSILEELGYVLVDRGSYWHSNAAFRQGDNGTALQIWKNSGVWRDFVGGSPPLPFVKLLQTHLGTNDKKALSKYLDSSSSVGESPHKKIDRLTMEKIYPDSLLEDLFPHYDFYNKKGISDAVLSSLKGGLATKGQMYQRFVFPVYNSHQQIHGFSGRDMSAREGAPKWKHLGRKSSWIYPYFVKSSGRFLTQEAIEESKKVFIVESIGDLLSLREQGYYNVLVSFGLDLSPKLICQLISLNDCKIVLSFNNDSSKSVNRGARAAVKSYLKLLSHFDLPKLSVCLPTQNDFGDMNKGDFAEWESKCQSSLRATVENLLPFAEKMGENKELPKNLLKNLKILRNHEA